MTRLGEQPAVLSELRRRPGLGVALALYALMLNLLFVIAMPMLAAAQPGLYQQLCLPSVVYADRVTDEDASVLPDTGSDQLPDQLAGHGCCPLPCGMQAIPVASPAITGERTWSGLAAAVPTYGATWLGQSERVQSIRGPPFSL